MSITTALFNNAKSIAPEFVGNFYDRLTTKTPCTVRTPTSRLRVGLLIDSLIGGGAERVVLNLAQAFQRLGHEVHVVLIKNEIQHALPTGIKIHALSNNGQLGGNRTLNKLLLAWKLHRLVSDIEKSGKRFDFFISNAEDADRISAMAGLPNVYIRYRNSMVEYMLNKIGSKTGLKRIIRQIRWRLRFQAIYSGRHIVTVSDALQNEIVDQMGIRPKSITTIYNPFEFSAIRDLAGRYVPPVAEPYIVYVAKFERRKRQDVLLHAYAQSKHKHTHKLVLIGSTYTNSDNVWLERMQALIVELGLSEQVVLPGFQTNPYPWIKNAALFAMSSDSEGLPTVLIESLILGTPVVSTDCPTGPREILTDELRDFLCQRDDPASLARIMDNALVQYPAIKEDQLARFQAEYSAGRYVEHCVGTSLIFI